MPGSRLLARLKHVEILQSCASIEKYDLVILREAGLTGAGIRAKL
jgi:hypothetical protein